jgi:hypothetical protein
MRRHLHIAAALLTFACGFVLAGAAAHLPGALAALLVASLLPALWRRLRRADYDGHRLKVVAFTLLFCLAPLAFFAAMLAPPAGGWASCTPGDDFGYAAPVGEPSHTMPPQVWEPSTPPCEPGVTYAAGDAHTNLLWAGALDAKALDKPEPFYPFEARAARVAGAVTVWVVVDDGTGLVLSATAVGGHPLLRHDAADAACFARFRPAPRGGPPVRRSGLLTYRFGP